MFPELPLGWGEPRWNDWGSSHLPYTLENRSRTELNANSLGRHLWNRQEESLQDHIAMQYEQQSTETALLRGLGCRLFVGGKAGDKSGVQKVLRKGEAYMRLSWWRKGFKHVGETKSWCEKTGGPKKPPNSGSLLIQHILGHAEQEEILPEKDLSRTQQVGASWRNKAHHYQLIMWREALANASKETSQSMWKSLKAGRVAAVRHLWAAGPPYPSQCREIPCASITGEVVPQFNVPASITVPRYQSLNASKA